MLFLQVAVAFLSDLKKNIIPPNDSMSVQVYFTPGTKRGYFSKIIFITLNDGKNYITPYIYGIIDSNMSNKKNNG